MHFLQIDHPCIKIKVIRIKAMIPQPRKLLTGNIAREQYERHAY